MSHAIIKNIVFVATSPITQYVWGVTYGTKMDVSNCVIDVNGQNTTGILVIAGGKVYNCDIKGNSTRPVSTGGYPLAYINGYDGAIYNCHIYNSRQRGLVCSSGNATGNVIHDCLDDGIYLSGANVGIGTYVAGNVIDNNDGHGINILSGEDVSSGCLMGNVITNHTASGKKGLRVTGGTSTVNDKLLFSRNNAFYNNAADYENISAGEGDISLSADPYVDRANADYNINDTVGGGASLRSTVITIPATTTTNLGVFRHLIDPLSGSGGVRMVNIRGGADQ
jgi:hypothetical protein